MARTILSEEEKRYVKTLVLELVEIRRQLDQLAEAMVRIKDKDFFKVFNVSKVDVSEKQVEDYQLTLQKQADATENEFR